MAVTWTQHGPLVAPLYEDVLSDVDLVAFWPMNEAAGSTIYDRCQKNRLTGTVAGNPTYAKSLGNGFYGLDFDGTGDRITFTNPSSLDFAGTSPFSLLCLTVPNISVDGTILSKSATSIGWEWYIEAAGYLNLFLRAAGGSIRVRHSVAITNGALTMLGTTYSGSTTAAGVILYKDGPVIAPTTITDTLGAGVTTNAGNANIGSYQSGTRDYNGDIGFVAVFSAVKDPDDYRRWAHKAGIL